MARFIRTLIRKLNRRPLPGRVLGPLTAAERSAYEGIISQDTKGW